MPKKRAFEEMVLAARGKERDSYSAALSAERGPLAYGKELSEEQQDEMWAYSDPQYADPRIATLLVTPKEQGGQGLTPLAASLMIHPHRRRLYEGEGPSITDHIAYAQKRQQRAAKKAGSLPPMPMPEPMAAPVTAPVEPMPDPTMSKPMPPEVAVPQPPSLPQATPPVAGQEIV